MLKHLFNLEDLFQILDAHSVIYFTVSLLLIMIAKFLNDRCVPYKLSEQLTTRDNKAIAVSFAGYLFAVAILIWNMLRSPKLIDPADSENLLLAKDLGSTAIWSLVGIVLLLVSRKINDRFLLYKFSNIKELEEDRNVGVGAVQAGAFIGTSLIISGAFYGDYDAGWFVSSFFPILYFIISQVAFILFGLLYQKVCGFDLHDELERDNAAAGTAYGMTLVALGILLSSYLFNYDSLLGLFVWFLIGAFLLLISRYIVDKLFLPGDLLDDEIRRDRNWGAALIEGSLAIGLAIILSSVFV